MTVSLWFTSIVLNSNPNFGTSDIHLWLFPFYFSQNLLLSWEMAQVSSDGEDDPNNIVPTSLSLTAETTTETQLPTLPFDVLPEILCRLPVKLLGQLRWTFIYLWGWPTAARVLCNGRWKYQVGCLWFQDWYSEYSWVSKQLWTNRLRCLHWEFDITLSKDSTATYTWFVFVLCYLFYVWFDSWWFVGSLLINGWGNL